MSGHLFPPTSSWVGIRIAYLLLPWRTRCPEQLGSPGVSFSGANPHWMTQVRCVWEAEGKRAWRSLDGEQSKLLTCEVVPTYSGQMFVPEAKYPQFQNSFSPLI